METPVIFLVFNRPDHTARVLARIREFQPRRLFVVADGPRAGNSGEKERCNAVRELIEAGVDWKCDVVRDYSQVNLGCARRVSSGITKAFERVDEAIIVEDDCLPDPSFFRFCSELLARFREDPRVGHIGGTHHFKSKIADSYYYSRYNHIWGWATWKRAWMHYDKNLKDWKGVRKSGWLDQFLRDSGAASFWRDQFDAVVEGRIDTWDFQWTYALWRTNALTVLPGTNLVQNIGFDGTGTHTRVCDRNLSQSASAIDFPLRHPPEISRDENIDRWNERVLFSGGVGRRIQRPLRRFARRCIEKTRFLKTRTIH